MKGSEAAVDVFTFWPDEQAAKTSVEMSSARRMRSPYHEYGSQRSE
jgi:hypothetical protein